MDWKLAAAKQRLSEVVRLAADEPQILFNRDRRVAAVISAEGLEEYLDWRAGRQRSVGDALQELTEICREEQYEYRLEPRTDRANPMDPEGRRNVPRRHKRRQ